MIIFGYLEERITVLYLTTFGCTLLSLTNGLGKVGLISPVSTGFMAQRVFQQRLTYREHAQALPPGKMPLEIFGCLGASGLTCKEIKDT